MTSYLVEVILVLALIVTAVRVTVMHREIKQLRSDQAAFCGFMGEAATAFETIVKTVNDLNCNGTHLIQLLGVKIDEARHLMADVDALPTARSRESGTAGEERSARRA